MSAPGANTDTRSADAATTERASSAAASALPTRARLLRAAEKLFAEQGIGPTSTRAILREAKQRNESALQYHFGGREGLIEALYVERCAEVGEERQRMLRELDDEADLRKLCEVAVMPPVRIARRQPAFLRFLKVVGQLAFLPSKKLQESQALYERETLAEVGRRMRPHLELPGVLLDRRVELMTRMAALSLAQRARSNESFEGPDADLFFETLLDAMTQVLEGTASGETERALAAATRAGARAARPKITRRKKANRPEKRKTPKAR